VSDPAALAPIVAAIASAFVVAGVGVIEGREILSVQRTPPDPVRRITRGPGRRATRARKHIVERETPQLLDLLAAGSTAGLSAELSFRQSARSLRGPLGDDLRAVIRAIDLGTPWRQALADYAEATGNADLRRTVSVLARTETLGVPLSEATQELASAVREARRSATLERARTAPVKMLFPLVFLILPAFLLLTVVPVLITTIRSIN